MTTAMSETPNLLATAVPHLRARAGHIPGPSLYPGSSFGEDIRKRRGCGRGQSVAPLQLRQLLPTVSVVPLSTCCGPGMRIFNSSTLL